MHAVKTVAIGYCVTRFEINKLLGQKIFLVLKALKKNINLI
jgi:hypothetical protein